MIRRILSDDAEERMPPPETKKELSNQQKETLARWVAAGAEYQPHWSLITPSRPEPPAVKNVAWISNPIDRFILAKLEAAGLEPAPEADRRTLARRLSLDLTGLPPEPADVEAFVNDASADAYEKLVDRLMASPHWGEHRGRYWLDAARYADTHGIHFDNFREMWSYRDWVIGASTATCRSTSSPSSSSPATCCPIARSISRSPRDSTAATSRPTKGASSTRSTSSSIPATARKRRRRYGWGSRPTAPSATTISSIR